MGQNIIFYFDICVKFTLSTITQWWRNDNNLFDVCYKATFSWLKYVWAKKIIAEKNLFGLGKTVLGKNPPGKKHPRT